MRLVIPAVLATMLASTAATAQEKLCHAPHQALILALEEYRKNRDLSFDPIELWSQTAATECKSGEVLTIYDPLLGAGVSWPSGTLIARHCDLTKQVVVFATYTAICYVIQPPRQ